MTNASQEERTGALITYILTGILGVLGALIGWLIFKSKGPFARSQTTEALNWGITLFIVFMILNILARVVPSLAMIFSLVSLVVWLGSLILSIMGGLKANGGNEYRYPFALRLIK